jgi:hypothetical protein
MQDQVAKLANPTVPYFGYLDDRARSRKDKEENKVIGSLV